MLELILAAASKVLDRVIPDPVAAASAKLEMMKLAQTGELAELDAQTKLAMAQISVNEADAKSGNTAQSTWRPAIGWVCAAALAWDTVLRPMLVFGFTMAGHPIPELPTLSSEQLYGLLFGLLGLGGMRSVEKIKGVA